MFKFLKEKLKSAVNSFSKKLDEEGKEEIKEEIVEKPKKEEKKEEIKKKEETKKPEKKESKKPKKEEAKKETKEKTETPVDISADEILEEIKEQEKWKKVKAKPSKREIEKFEEEFERVEDIKDKEIEEIEKPKEIIIEEDQAKDFEKELKDITESESRHDAPETPLEIEESIQDLKEIFTKKKKEKPEKIEEIEIPDFKDIEKEIQETKESKEYEKPKKGFFGRLFSKKEETPEESKEIKEETQKIKEEDPKKIEVETKEIEDELKKVDVEKETKYYEQKKEQEALLKKAEEEAKKPQEEKGFFKKISEKITTKKINEKQFEELFWDMEVVLLENNVAVEVIEKIKDDLKKELVDIPIKKSQISERIISVLKSSLDDLFNIETIDLFESAKNKKPFVICLLGINGSGKTTTIAKLANAFQEKGLSVVLAAADTFRAAAIDQLQTHGDKLGIKVIKHDYGSDAAAVAFDAIKHAEAKNKDIVLIDTAGRMHSNVNLVDELKKIIKVANPDVKIFIGESITGNDCVEQAKKFNEAIGIDGIILSKADIDEKGGAAISVSYVTQKPILFIGTGQEYNDLELFHPDLVLNSLGL